MQDIQSRVEAFLAAIAGESGIVLPVPQSRIEEWLAEIVAIRLPTQSDIDELSDLLDSF